MSRPDAGSAAVLDRSEVESLFVHPSGRVMYVTERAVFRLGESGIELVEAAPGIDVRKDILGQIDFEVSDGARSYPVTYRGLVPDTFTDANDIEVIVEGRLGRDGVFRATEVLAKCGSRYEAAAEGKQA